jgi:hypothetical protein
MNDQLRISDADREAAARELGEHFATGRITAEEHTERLEQIWAARTAADLRPVFRDLPRQQAAQAPRSPSASPTPRQRAWPPMPHVPFLFKVLVGIVVLALAFHHLAFLLIALLVYLFVVRRFVHRSRWNRPGGRTYTRWR